MAMDLTYDRSTHGATGMHGYGQRIWRPENHGESDVRKSQK
jgi:hypothetical protein